MHESPNSSGNKTIGIPNVRKDSFSWSWELHCFILDCFLLCHIWLDVLCDNLMCICALQIAKMGRTLESLKTLEPAQLCCTLVICISHVLGLFVSVCTEQYNKVALRKQAANVLNGAAFFYVVPLLFPGLRNLFSSMDKILLYDVVLEM